MYQGSATSAKTTPPEGVLNKPSDSSAGNERYGPRGTLQVDSVDGAAPVRLGSSEASRCCWYQSCAQNGSSWNMCTWLKRSAGWLPAYSTRASSGPSMYPKPPVRV